MKAGKMISTALSAVLAAGIMAFFPGNAGNISVSADSGFIIKTDADGDKYISGYNGSGGDIVIPGDVTWIGKQAFYGNRDITSVTFPESCWYWVDKQAFAFCPNLKSIDFQGSIGGIGDSAFYACTSLEKVTFGGDVSNSSDGGIGSYAFSYCTSLKKVSFSDPDAEVDMLGGCAFSDCIKLSSITLPSGLDMIYDDVFVNCSALTEISIPSHARIKGSHVLGYMYGKSSSSSGNKYVKADGSTSCSINYWKNDNGNYSASTGKITQKNISVTAAKGSDGAKYAVSEGLNCIYTDEEYDEVPEKLPVPKNISYKKSAGKIVLTWDDVDGADGYRVYIYDADTGKYNEYKSVRTSQCTFSDAENGKEYKFIVAALDLTDGGYVRGKASKAVTVET